MLMVFILAFGTISCGTDIPVETAPPTEIATVPPTAPPTEMPTEPPTEPPVDPFTVEDGIVDSTNDIVIDFYAFLEERNAAHKAVLDTTVSDEFIKDYAPDFHDTMNLVSTKEAQYLLQTRIKNHSEFTTKDDALKDVDLLFRIFKSFYGPYYYFGGDDAFGAAQERIIQKITDGPYQLTLNTFANIICSNLDFVLDRHMVIGGINICDYNNVSVYDFCVQDLYFYQDDVGYYTRINDRKWYLVQIGTDAEILNYLKITVDEKGQLCYCILLCEPSNGSHHEISEITLSRGDRTATKPIQWTRFSKRSSGATKETVTVKNNIPLLRVGYYANSIDAGSQDAQAERIRKMGRSFLAQDVFIYDFVSGSSCQALFESIQHGQAGLSMYRMSQLALDMGKQNMPWYGQNIAPHSVRLSGIVKPGSYAVYSHVGLWGRNDTISFTVQDKNNFSAAEDSISDIRAIENCLTIGGSTGGTAGYGSATCQLMVLYNTHLLVNFGATLSVTYGHTADGFCIEPDIWYEPKYAAAAAYRICEFYGIENYADTSMLGK